MNYILVGKNGRPSIRAVSDSMKEPHVVLMRKKYRRSGNIRWFKLEGKGDRYKWVKHLPKNTNPSFEVGDVIIRWGFAGVIDTTLAKVLQSASSISLISNKGQSRVVMSEHDVPVPRTVVGGPIGGYPMIIRPIKHSRGKDFYTCCCDAELLDAVEKIGGELYCSEIYPKVEEIRVYVAHGKVLMIKDKGYRPEHGLRGNRGVTHAEWTVVPPEGYKRYKSACKAACDAVRAVGAVMGGVDVMINRSNDSMPVCVCEINAAPTIKSSEYGVQRYAKYFDWLFRGKRKWWKYIHPETGEERDHPELGKSYFFTNKQLEE